MALDLISAVIILFWMAQGIYTAWRIFNEGYHPLWAVGMLAFAFGLAIPLFAIFT